MIGSAMSGQCRTGGVLLREGAGKCPGGLAALRRDLPGLRLAAQEGSDYTMSVVSTFFAI